MTRRVLLVAPCVAPLGHGATGGVTHSVQAMVGALASLGAEIDVMAPAGSAVPPPARALLVEGAAQPSLGAADTPAVWPVVADGALAAMWRRMLAEGGRYNAILNLQHDWLGYFLTEALAPRLFHLPNMGRVNPPTDLEIARVAREHPAHIAFLSKSHAATFDAGPKARILHLALDLARYPFVAEPQDYVAWAGRIARVKGLEAAAAAAAHAGYRLKVAGYLEDPAYLAELEAHHGRGFDYVGYLDQPALAQLLGHARALLQTQDWHEALGIVTLEALAVGTPVIAAAKGANRDLIADGQWGLLVETATPDQLAAALARIGSLDRQAGRAFIEKCYSPARLRADLANWLPAFAGAQAFLSEKPPLSEKP